MADGNGDLAATPSAVLELKEERQLVQEGYDFLDEKRLLLAAELLRQQERYQALMGEYSALLARARDAMAAAVTRHGLQGVQVYPCGSLLEARVAIETRSFLGVVLADGSLEMPPSPSAPARATYASPEAEQCRALFLELIQRAAALAAVTSNIHRMAEEYRRTERRARALEDVLLPEIEQALHDMSARLEDADLEETLRTRLDYGRARRQSA